MNAIIGLLLFAAVSTAGAESVPNTARTITSTAQHPFVEGRRFQMSGRVVFQNLADIVLEDETGVVFLNRNGRFTVDEGDRVIANGSFSTNVIGQVYPLLKEITTISHGELPRPESITVDQYRSGAYDYRLVQMVGFVKDVFSDEIDLNWTDIIVQCEREPVLVSYISKDKNDAKLRQMIGKRVRFHGITRLFPSGVFRPARRVLIVSGTGAFEPLETSVPDPFDAPELSQLIGTTVEDILAQNRHRTSGRVIAVCKGPNFLLRNADGFITEVSLANSPVPAYGSDIEVSGFPATDSYNINLEHALWRPCKEHFPSEEVATDIRPTSCSSTNTGIPVSMHVTTAGRSG